MHRWWKWTEVVAVVGSHGSWHIFHFSANWISCRRWLQFIYNPEDLEKKSYVKDLQGSARNVSDKRLFEEDLLWKLLFNFNPAFYARLVLIQSATLSLGTGAMLWERIWNEMLFQMDKWPAIQQVHERILTSTIVFLLLFYCYHFLKRVQRR